MTFDNCQDTTTAVASLVSNSINRYECNAFLNLFCLVLRVKFVTMYG